MPSSSASVARDAEQLALDEAPLDLAPLLRRVAGAVRREAAGAAVEALGGEPVDQLGRLAALREADRPLSAPTSSASSLDASASALARRPSSSSSSSGFQSAIVRSARGAPSPSITCRLDPGERLDELAGVRDRGRGEQELRLGAVDAGEPPQPAQDVRRRASRRPRGRRAPRRRRRSAGSRARRPSGRGAAARRCGACPGWSGSGSPTCGSASAARRACRRRRSPPGRSGRRTRSAAQLILRERLRRIEVERAQLRLARERVEHGEVEGERLAGGGAGRDDEVPAGAAASQASR